MGDVKRDSASDAGQAAAKGRSAVPDPEVPEKPERRKYSAEYELRILQEVDMCSEPRHRLSSLLDSALGIDPHEMSKHRRKEAGSFFYHRQCRPNETR